MMDYSNAQCMISCPPTPYVYCTDATDKPLEVPGNGWIHEGVVYTVERILVHPDTELVSLVLHEVKPGPVFEAYRADRFVPFPFSPN